MPKPLSSKRKLKSIKNELGRFLANDLSEHDAIIPILLKAKEETPNELVDYLEGVNVWEKVEFSFTVAEFCDIVGL